MFRYSISVLVLVFVSSVCYAHKVNGEWHRHGIDGPYSYGASSGVHSHESIKPSTTPPPPASTSQPSPASTSQSQTSGASTDNNTQDDNDATGAAVNTAPRTTPSPQKVVITTKPLMITEYMLRDWSKTAGGGLPQWIEIYNPNLKPLSLNGYQFTHAYKRFANHPWMYVTTSITEFTIPAGDAVIIASKSAGTQSWKIGGISKKDVWIIPYDGRKVQLKNGWHLMDPNGVLVHRIGTAFQEYPADDSSAWDLSLGRPWLPSHNSDGYRVSHQRYPSEGPDEAHFYGNQNDVGSPGFYEAAAPAAPSLQRPKLTTTWGHLKRGKYMDRKTP